MGFNPLQFAQQALQGRPDLMQSNKPIMQNMVNAIMTGNQAAGEEIANNLLKSYGVSKEDAIKQAQEFFGIK